MVNNTSEWLLYIQIIEHTALGLWLKQWLMLNIMLPYSIDKFKKDMTILCPSLGNVIVMGIYYNL